MSLQTVDPNCPQSQVGRLKLAAFSACWQLQQSCNSSDLELRDPECLSCRCSSLYRIGTSIG